jgi:hypothetical protein
MECRKCCFLCTKGIALKDLSVSKFSNIERTWTLLGSASETSTALTQLKLQIIYCVGCQEFSVQCKFFGSWTLSDNYVNTFPQTRASSGQRSQTACEIHSSAQPNVFAGNSRRSGMRFVGADNFDRVFQTIIGWGIVFPTWQFFPHHILTLLQCLVSQ